MNIDMTHGEAAAIVATACGNFDSDTVEDVLFIVKRICPLCNRPHILTVFGTTDTDKDAITMLAQGIQRISQEGLFDNV